MWLLLGIADIIYYYKYRFMYILISLEWASNIFWYGMIILQHRLYLRIVLCYIHCICYYTLLWHVLYILVNIDQDEMKPVHVNNYYLAGKIEENKIALKFL